MPNLGTVLGHHNEKYWGRWGTKGPILPSIKDNGAPQVFGQALVIIISKGFRAHEITPGTILHTYRSKFKHTPVHLWLHQTRCKLLQHLRLKGRCNDWPPQQKTCLIHALGISNSWLSFCILTALKGLGTARNESLIGHYVQVKNVTIFFPLMLQE